MLSQRIPIYWLYYKSVFGYCFAFSLIGLFNSFATFLILFCTLALFIAIAIFEIRKKKEYLFYYNLNVSKTSLILWAFLINVAIALTLLLLWYIVYK